MLDSMQGDGSMGSSLSAAYVDVRTCLTKKILVLLSTTAGSDRQQFVYAMTEPEVTAAVLMNAKMQARPKPWTNISSDVRQSILKETTLYDIIPTFAATDYKAIYFAYKEFLAQPTCCEVPGKEADKKKNVPFFVVCYGCCLHELVEQAIILESVLADDSKLRTLASLAPDFVKAAAKDMLNGGGTTGGTTPPWRGSAFLHFGQFLQQCAQNFTAASAIAKSFPGEEFDFLAEILNQLKQVLSSVCGGFSESISKSMSEAVSNFTPTLNAAVGVINVVDEFAQDPLKKEKIMKLTRDDNTKKILTTLPALQDHLCRCKEFLPALHAIGSAIESQDLINMVSALQQDLKELTNGKPKAPVYRFTKYAEGESVNIQDMCLFAGSVTLAQALVREVGEKETRPGIIT